MKRRIAGLFLLVLIAVTSGCTTTDREITYTPQEIEDGKQGSYELMSLALNAALKNTIDSIEELSTSAFFTAEQYKIIEEHLQKPGVSKRLTIFTTSLKKALKEIIFSSLENQEQWIQSIPIEEPYQYILGASNSLTTLFTPYGKEYLRSYISSQLPQYDSLVIDFQKFVTILNTYILTYNENNPTNKKETISQWDTSQMIEEVSSIVFQKMERQEAIIRSLAPSYESPYIRLYKVQ